MLRNLAISFSFLFIANVTEYSCKINFFFDKSQMGDFESIVRGSSFRPALIIIDSSLTLRSQGAISSFRTLSEAHYCQGIFSVICVLFLFVSVAFGWKSKFLLTVCPFQIVRTSGTSFSKRAKANSSKL
jgi:hypothetical protein